MQIEFFMILEMSKILVITNKSDKTKRGSLNIFYVLRSNNICFKWMSGAYLQECQFNRFKKQQNAEIINIKEKVNPLCLHGTKKCIYLYKDIIKAYLE